MREIAELVRMGQPDGLKTKWKHALIEREPVVSVALRIRKAVDALTPNPSVTEAAEARAERFETALNRILSADGWEQAYDIAKDALGVGATEAKREEMKECWACRGYGHFSKWGKPSADRSDRKCLECSGEGKVNANPKQEDGE